MYPTSPAPNEYGMQAAIPKGDLWFTSLILIISSDTIKYELTRNLPLLDRVLSDVPYQSADNLGTKSKSKS